MQPPQNDAELARRLTEIVRAAPSLMQVLRTVRSLDLPDWLVMSGAVYQRVLNHLTGRAPDYGVRDYDLGYFDASDISYEAEDIVIRRVAAAFDEPLKSTVEVRNQARVHVWFEAHFGEAYTPLSSAPPRRCSALSRRCSRSACASKPTTGCTSRRRSASPICSRCVCGRTHGGRSAASTGSPPASSRAGPS